MENLSRNGKYKFGLIKNASIVSDLDDTLICPFQIFFYFKKYILQIVYLKYYNKLV